jgi:hypothetical protein
LREGGGATASLILQSIDAALTEMQDLQAQRAFRIGKREKLWQFKREEMAKEYVAVLAISLHPLSVSP